MCKIVIENWNALTFPLGTLEDVLEQSLWIEKKKSNLEQSLVGWQFYLRHWKRYSHRVKNCNWNALTFSLGTLEDGLEQCKKKTIFGGDERQAAQKSPEVNHSHATTNLCLPLQCHIAVPQPKGQLISKCLFGVVKSTQKTTKFFPGFLPKPLKRGQIKK